MCNHVTVLQGHLVIVIKVILEIDALTVKSPSNHSFFDCLKNVTANKSVNLNV